MMNMMSMMKKAQNIQKKLIAAQEELAAMEINGTAGSGSVNVTCNGRGLFKSITLTAEAINPDNPSSVSDDTIELLEDLITTAMNKAIEDSHVIMDEKMTAITGGISIPGLI